MENCINENINCDNGDKKNFEEILRHMLSLNASDIWITSSDVILADIQGYKKPITKFAMSYSSVESLIKTIDGDNSISRLYEGQSINKAYQFTMIGAEKNRLERFRINITGIFKQKGGFQITIRHIPQKIPTLAEIGLSEDDPIFQNFFPLQGLVLVAGATGSGKSTLMASCIAKLLSRENSNKIINSYEHPIEFVFDDYIKGNSRNFQSSVPDMMKSFAEGIKESLRRKPDIIVVGELRDKETIEAALEACQTGHLVIGTVHTNGVPQTVKRLINQFQAGERDSRQADIIECLQMIVSQRLVKTTDFKRMAVREFLTFDNELKDKIADSNALKIPSILRGVLNERQSGIFLEADKFYKQGLILEEDYEEIKRVYK